MQADPQRQWFVYHNEKEMGPFNEDDVKKKLTAGELTSNAYLFTEGMSDWALVNEVELFKAKPSAAAGATSLSKSRDDSGAKAFAEATNEFSNTGASSLNANPELRQSADPTVRATRGSQIHTHIPEPALPASNRRRVLMGLLALLVVALGYLIYQDQKKVPKPEDVSKQLETGAKKLLRSAESAASQSSVDSADVDWKELQELRESTDPTIAPFRIASGNLGGERPLIVGVISQMIKADRVFVSVYSDNEKSYSAIPRIWFLDAQVLDGYFTVGPFSNEGKALSPGTYHVAVAANGNFLGKVSFVQGPTPTSNELLEIEKKIQTERGLLSQKEMSSLNEKLQEMLAAFSQLEVIGRIASGGPRKALEWKSKSQPWRKILRGALEDQRSVLAGPMFYGEAQTQLYNFMSSLMKHFEALDIQAKEGPAFLIKVKGKGLGPLWAQLKKEKDELSGNIQAALKNPPGALKIDPEVVKNRLVEVSK